MSWKVLRAARADRERDTAARQPFGRSRCQTWQKEQTTMPDDIYLQNPALRPTVIVHDVLRNVYRPTLQREPAGERQSGSPMARETPRAA